VETLAWSAEEAKRIHGETIPVEAAPGGADKFSFTIRVPCGVVAAITPFNFPLNLVMHKVGPALAAGNAVIVKPASDTPLSALKLVELLLEAGLPAEAIQCVTGLGAKLGGAISTDPRVRKISFTGSLDVGEQICRLAGIKKVTMELGSNCPVVVMRDADLDEAVRGVVVTGFANAGQVCLSAQRILVDSKVYADFLDLLKPKVEEIVPGDPLEPGARMGPLIRESDAVRVNQWIQEALDGGARLITGGGRRGVLHEATVVADVHPDMAISRKELFGPAVAVTPFRNRRGDQSGQRHQLRSRRRHLHQEHRLGPEVCPGGGRREPARQLGLHVARRPHALRRAEGQRHGERRPDMRGGMTERRPWSSTKNEDNQG
jgi:glyceraldehyde-3-phosphate dehydrogenase (NADP+)